MKCRITKERLHELLTYNPATGVLRWKVSYGRARKDDIAGSIDRTKGYIRVGIDNVNYHAHRIIFMMMTGAWPSQCDHKNRIRSDNRWENLRDSTSSQNHGNSGIYSTNSNGLKGVHWDRRRDIWCACIMVNYKSLFLCYFDCRAAASLAYQIAADKHFGEFARWKADAPRKVRLN